MTLPVFFAVAVGGACGALARWSAAMALRDVLASFPFATFAINAVGCFAFGLLWAMHGGKWPAPVAAATFAGFLGAFTTFSTFAFESIELLQQGRMLACAANVVGQNVIGVLAVAGGLALGRAA
jgi:CrcB protein